MPANRWMTDVLTTIPAFGNRPLSEITLPATHNAGCYVRHSGCFGESYNSLFARTQDHVIALQLAGGIRYFDIRPYYSKEGEYWSYRGPFGYYGGRLDGNGGILDQVANYLNTRDYNHDDGELVILNVSHFSGFNLYHDYRHQTLIRRIQFALGNHLVQHRQDHINLFNTAYINLLQDGTGSNQKSRVAIIYDGALDTRCEAYITNNVNNLPAGFFTISPKYMHETAENRIYLFDQYAHSNDLNAMSADQINKLKQRDNYQQQYRIPAGNWDENAVGGIANTLHTFSWILTPSIWGYPTNRSSKVSNPVLLNLFTGNNWGVPMRPYSPILDPKINILSVNLYASEVHNHAGCQRHNYAIPVAIADYLNRYTPHVPGLLPVPANFPGWDEF